MKNAILTGLVATLFVSLFSGCSTYVTKEQYDRDVNLLKQTNDDLARRNAELEPLAGTTKWQMYAAERYAELTAELKARLSGVPGVTVDPSGKLILEDEFFFSAGRAEIKDKGATSLREIAKEMKSAGLGALIVGHTDDTPINRSGPRYGISTNLELGMLRAKNVMLELHKAGIPETRMYLKSDGQNSPKETKAKSRRVEIYLLKGLSKLEGDKADQPAKEKKAEPAPKEKKEDRTLK